MKKGLLLASALLLSPLTTVAEPSFPHLQVQGYGEVAMVPDSASFSVEVRKSARTATEAKQQADQTVNAFIDRLMKAGIEREAIESANISLYPEYRYGEDRQREQVGFFASRMVTVQVADLEQLNPLLNAALGDGVDAINHIQMKVSNEAVYQKQARQLAIADAQLKAEEIAKGFNMTVEGVWQINYHSSNPVPMTRGVAYEAMADSGSYQDTKITTQDTISVTFKLK
ncbi:SIMPL domain-containing protein [Thaumasiovibrio subtropicus]|uniref:SIMPL domain-containing protein n=1 Tax=Thaumasiovibrio subtropicus TaxID=1891207 RepID=UPI000B363E6F|nr:SIMPL domain-containing protein [Thaumasiovibrio subtropicus]